MPDSMADGVAGRSARDLGPEDLTWDFFSRPRTEPPIDRVFAAAEAGFAGIGLYIGAWKQLRADADALLAFDEALASTGIVVANIEVVRGWSSSPTPTDDCAASEALAYEMADRFGCRYMQAIGDSEGDLDSAVAGFAGLCDRAGEHGLLVGLEWVPEMTTIEDAATANAIVTEADRPNGGLCVDAWHLTRSTNDLDDLAKLDTSRIFATQFNDGPIEPEHPDYYTDTLSNRRLPGHGEFSLIEMITELDRLGSVAPIGIEVPSTELSAQPVGATAIACIEAMRTVLAAARS